MADAPPVTASEDFPFFNSGNDYGDGPPVPTVYWFLGSASPQQWFEAPGETPAEKTTAMPSNHSPQFAPDPTPTRQTGLRALTTAALTWLGQA